MSLPPALGEYIGFVLDRLGEGITVQDRSGRLVYANQSGARLTGFDSVAELMSTPVDEVVERFEILDEEGAPFPVADLPGRRALRGEQPPEVLLQIRDRRTGAARWSAVQALPVLDGEGEVLYAVNLFRDISEQMEAGRRERAVSESLRKLEQVTQAALAHVTKGDLLDEMLRQIASVLDADTSAILLLDEERQYLTVQAALGFDREIEHAVPIPYGKGMAGTVAASAKPVVIRDLDEVELVSPHLRMRGIASLVAIPLVVDGSVIGVAHTGSVEPDHFDASDLRLFTLIADRLSLAIAQLRLFEAERRARHDAERAHNRLSFLAEASTILASSLDYEATLGAVARLAVPHLADWCAVHIASAAGRLERIALAHATLETSELAGLETALFRAHEDDPVGPAAVLRTGSAELVPEVADDVLAVFGGAGSGAAALSRLGFASYMCVPMHGRDRVLGTIAFAVGDPARRFDETDLAVAEELARRTAVAFENAILFREAEERGRAARVLAAVGDGVFLVDAEGFVRLWNPAAEAITGLSAEVVLNRPAREAIPGWEVIAPRIPVAADLGTTATRAETVPFEARGRELWLSISGVGFADGTVYAFRDLTQDRALEELKGEFVSTVSHELRTPLAAIYGAAMTLKRPDLPDDSEHTAKLLDVIARESERLATIVNDILWASRLDSGAVHLAIRSFDPEQLAQSVLESTEVHRPQGIELSLEAQPELPPVAADPDKTRQVLVNLVDNAIKYSPDGGRVSIELSAGDTSMRFSVHDEGLGIPAAEQRQIFEKFYRLDPNMTRGVGGTGLGLYICRELVHRMQGRIWVVSPKSGGKGSTFAFELPLARPSQP